MLLRADQGLFWIAAIITLALADDERALDAFEEARAEAYRRGSLFSILSVHLWYGCVMLFHGQLDEAEKWLTNAEEDQELWGSGQIAAAYVYGFLAGVQIEKGDLAAAARTLAKAEPVEGPADGVNFWRRSRVAVLILEAPMSIATASSPVIRRGEENFDQARQAFNLVVDQRPEQVAYPSDAYEVAALVRRAREQGLRIAPQRTAHNAGPIDWERPALLLRTDAMKGVEIDAVNRTARVNAGAQWMDLVDDASEMGLAALHGSARDIGIAGYSLGGGVGWLARKHGLQANSVRAIELVTADGELVRADHHNEPELFWALRGGGGNFGVVTALEFDLYPVDELYAGALFFGFERGGEVLHAWREWTAGLPDEITSVVKLLQLPDLPEIPDPLRGKSFAIVMAAALGGESAGAELMEPIRGLGPEMDTFSMVPPAALSWLAMDPEDPLPYTTSHHLLGELPAVAVDELIGLAGPGTGSPLTMVELRHLGGAMGRSAPHHGARATLEGEYLFFALGGVLAPEDAAPMEAAVGRVADAMAPWAAGRTSTSWRRATTCRRPSTRTAGGA